MAHKVDELDNMLMAADPSFKMAMFAQNAKIANSPFPAKEEAISWNVYREFEAIDRFKNARGFENDYEKGRYKTLQYIIKRIEGDPINADYQNEEIKQIMREAGELLYNFTFQSDGKKGINDGLVWAFIPKRYRRDIELIWDGIGEWRA